MGRGTVWADLGLSPLAFAVEQLALLAECTALQSETGDLSALTSAYAERGWKTDDAAVRGFRATPKRADREAVAVAVNMIYRPWLDAGAVAFQGAIGPMANAGTYQPGPSASSRPGTVAVFVDGLRLDVAHRILDRLAGAALEVDLITSLAALPTVTQTAKPVLVPLAVGSLTAGPGLDAANAATGTKASIQVLRSLMADAGIQVLSLQRRAIRPGRHGLRSASWITEATLSASGSSTTSTRTSTVSWTASASYSMPAGNAPRW